MASRARKQSIFCRDRRAFLLDADTKREAAVDGIEHDCVLVSF